MSYEVRFTAEARADLKRMYRFLAYRDPPSARRALAAIRKATDLLRFSPFSCRKATGANPFVRELVVPFGASGYVLLFEVDDSLHVTIVAVRHQREADYH